MSVIATAAGEGSRLLVVEPDKIGRQVLAGLLRGLGYEIEQAATPHDKEAAAALARGEFAALLAAATTFAEGPRTLEEWPEEIRATPLVVILEVEDPGQSAAWRRSGAMAVVAKPLKLEVLRTAMDSVAGQRTGPEAPIDREAALELLGGDESFLKRLQDVFLTDMPSSGDELVRAAEAGEPEMAAKAAHSIKSAAGVIGALRLQRLAENLDKGADGLSPEALRAGARDVAAELQRVLAAISPQA